jgi:dTDP-glucose 4,6-dehydratase
VEDHCSALHTVLQRGRVGETYNIGGNNELRNIDLVRLLCAILDELAPRDDVSRRSPLTTSHSNTYSQLITFVTDRPGHDLRYAIDPSKICQELAWEPVQDHQSGFRKTVQWYLSHQEWWKQILTGDYQLQRQGVSTVQPEITCRHSI